MGALTRETHTKIHYPPSLCKHPLTSAVHNVLFSAPFMLPSPFSPSPPFLPGCRGDRVSQTFLPQYSPLHSLVYSEFSPQNQLLSPCLVAFFTLLARCIVLMHWKNPLPPTHSHWIKDALFFMKLEKIRYSLKGSEITSSKIWSPLLNHAMSLTLDVTP